MGRSAGQFPAQVRKWWMCSKGKYYEENMAPLRLDISGGAGSTGNSTTSSNSPDFQW